MEQTPDTTNASDLDDTNESQVADVSTPESETTAVSDDVTTEPEHETDLLAGVEPVDAPAPPTHEDLTGSPEEPLVEEPEAHDVDEMDVPTPSFADGARVDDAEDDDEESAEPDAPFIEATDDSASEAVGDEILTAGLDINGGVDAGDPITSRDSMDSEVAEPEVAAPNEIDLTSVEAPAEEEDDAALLDWQPGEWFVVHTYAGYENKVKTNLMSRIVSMNMEEKIYEVVIPVEDVMEVKSGKKQVVQRKVFPGYLLVRMDLDDDSWYVVRNTPGVTGFVGSGTKPIPLSEREVDRVLQRKGAAEERPKPQIEFSSGDNVRVVTGPFANFQGIISEIDMDRSKLKVLVNIFGRETPVELGFDQVAKI